jgi:tetratricopeptide (TPR) repeat protein
LPALSLLPSETTFRLGIGLCYHKLGELDKARRAYRRVLDLVGHSNSAWKRRSLIPPIHSQDPRNVDALAAIIVLDLNSGDGETSKS